MPDLPPELRDRAARAACDVYTEIRLGRLSEFDRAPWEWRAVVDAVAEVLDEHFGADRLLDEIKRANVLSKMWEMDRDRAERAEADLARARNLASEVLHLMRFRLDGRPVSIGEAHTLIAWSRGVLASGPAGAAHTEEET